MSSHTLQRLVRRGSEVARCAVSLFLLAGGVATAGEADHYVSLGLAAVATDDTRFADVDCLGTDVAAYFGCSDGPDGRPIGAYGDVSGVAVRLAVGRRLHEWLRGEIELGYLPNASFEGLSNFSGVAIGTAPVAMTVDSATLMATAHVEILPMLGHDAGRLQPFVSAGLGVSHNRVGEGVYGFPTLGEGAETIVPPGTRTGLAWSLGAGVSVEASERVTIDISYRFVDRGEVGSDAGPIRIVRPGKDDFVIPVGATWADFGTHEFGISLRQRF